MVTGAIVDVCWLVFMAHTGIYEIIPGFICSLVASVVVTMADKEPDEGIKAIFDKAAAEDFDE